QRSNRHSAFPAYGERHSILRAKGGRGQRAPGAGVPPTNPFLGAKAMSQTQTDHNLLFGILAYQNAFITRDALFTGMQAWLYNKSKTLAEILHNQGALDADRRDFLEGLVRLHLKQNGDDPKKSLQAVSSVSSVRDELKQLPDPALQVSIAHLSKAR